MTTELTKSETSKLKKNEQIIKKTKNAFYECGRALAEIRDLKLYRLTASTFEEYCQSKWQIERRRAYQLIEASEVVDKLPENVKKITQTESHARALSKIPESKRAEVLEKVSRNGKVTESSIDEAVRIEKEAHEHIIVRKDRTGFLIPEMIVEDWDKSEAIGKELLGKASDLKCAIENGKNDDDVLFRSVSQTCISYSMNLFSNLKELIPYCVCTSCQGHGRKKCTLCKGRGFISEFIFKNAIPEETKELRKKIVR